MKLRLLAFCFGLTTLFVLAFGYGLHLWRDSAVRKYEEVAEAALVVDDCRKMRDDLRRAPADPKRDAALAIMDHNVERMEKLLDGVRITPELLIDGRKKIRDDLRNAPANVVRNRDALVAALDKEIAEQEKRLAAAR
jgi:hypothetical protein